MFACCAASDEALASKPPTKKEAAQAVRDAAFFKPLSAAVSYPELFKEGTVTVTHDADTLKRCADKRGALPDTSVKIAYMTSFDPTCHSPSKHLVLVHPTSCYQDSYYVNMERARAAGLNADVLNDIYELQSISDRIHSMGL